MGPPGGAHAQARTNIGGDLGRRGARHGLLELQEVKAVDAPARRLAPGVVRGPGLDLVGARYVGARVVNGVDDGL